MNQLQAAQAPVTGKWRLVVLLSSGLAFDYLARLAIFSVLPLMRKDLAVSEVALGLIASSFLWTYGALSPLAGMVGDRFSRRTVVILSLVGWSAVTLLSGFVTSDSQLVVMRILLAIMQVCYMPVGQALLADFHGSESRGRASGFFQSGSSIGIFLAGFPVAWLAIRVGWRNMLIICGALGLLYSLVMWRYLPRPPARTGTGSAEPPMSLQQALALLRIRSVLAMMAMFAMTSMAYWVLFSYLPLFVYEQYHLSLEAAAFQATFYIQITAVVAMPFYATISDRLTVRDPRYRYLACAVASSLGLPALLAMGIGTHIAVLTVGLFLFGVAMASSDASWLAMLCNVTAPRQRATAYGLLNFSGTLAGGFAAFATAVLMKRFGLGFLIASLGAMYVLISSLMLACGYWFLKRDQRHAL